jgi:hypothetical protein
MTGTLPILLAMLAQAPQAPPSAPTSYDCALERPSPRGSSRSFWRLLPDGRVIQTSGGWASTWRADAVRLSLAWGGTDPEPLKPDTVTSLSPPAAPDGSDRRRRVRMELRVPGALGNIYWFAFATPFGPWSDVANRAILNWGELLAMAHGSQGLELRIADQGGRVRATAMVDVSLIEEARRAASEVQGEMIALARDFRRRCQPYFSDPYNADIVL